MASKKNHTSARKNAYKKKTSIGNSTRTKHKRPGPSGGNKGYKKKYRGQGK